MSSYSSHYENKYCKQFLAHDLQSLNLKQAEEKGTETAKAIKKNLTIT